MEAATLAASIMPVNGQQSTGKLGAKSDSKAVKGAFANLLLALQGYAPTEAQNSSGTTTTDPTDQTGKEAASNSLLLALSQLLPGQSQSSSGTTTTDPTDQTGKEAASNSLLLALSQLLPGQSQSSSGTTTTDPTDQTGKEAASNSLLLALSQLLPGQSQSSSGTTTTDPTDQTGKEAASNSLLLALSQLLPGQSQSSSGTTTTDPTDQTGKEAASNSLLLALSQLLPGQSQSSSGMTQTTGNSGDSGGSGTVPAMSVAGLSSIINQVIDSLQASGNTGQVDKGLLADLTGLSQALQGNQTSAGKTGPTSTAGTDQAPASNSLFKNADGQAADLPAAVKTALSQADPGVLNDNAPEGSAVTAVNAGVLPRAPDGTTTTVSLNSQTLAKTGANGLSSPGASLKGSGAPTVTQGTVGSTAQSKTGQATGALSQSSQDSSMAGHSKEAPVKDTSFVKPVSALETQQPQASSLQSPSGSEEMNSLLTQSSLQQRDLSSLTGLGQTVDSKSPTLGAGVINQIVASANLAVNNDNASMRIQLKPEWLGDLKLVVDVEQGVVNAHFITQNQVTASLIQARLPELKQALNDQGISWQHLSVSSGADQGNQGASSQSQQNMNQSQSQYDYGYEDSPDSDVQSTIPMAYQMAGTGTFNYIV